MADQPDAVDVLEADHRAVEMLLSQLEQQAEATPKHVLEEAVRALSMHSAVEVELLYPLVADRLEGGADMAKQARLDHEEAEMSMLRLQSVPMSTEEFRSELSRFVAEVRAHVRTEETTIFPLLRAGVDSRTLADLGSRLEHAKRHAPTRPHPHAPKSALAAKLADRLAGTVDRLRDRAHHSS
jgi:hemerythrin superfamily protein